MYKHLVVIERALRDIEQHHAHMNRKVGRPEEKSYTLSKVREALGALAAIEAQGGIKK